MKKIGLFCLALLIVGCSSSKNTSSKNTFTVGMECNYAPFNWTTLEKNDTTISISSVDYCDGYDVAIAKKIADDLGKELVIKKISWEGLEPALSSNEIDAIIAGMSETPERAQNVNFTTPYYESEMVLIIKKDSKYINSTDIQDFANATVLGQLNTTYDEIIDQIENVNHATPLPTYPLMIVALQSGEVDAITAELPVAEGVISSNEDLTYIKFEKNKGFEVDSSVSIAIAKNNDELLKQVQTSLDKISIEERNELMLLAVNRQPAGE